MKIEDFLTQFVEDLDSEALIMWAVIHKIYPVKKEDVLRKELTKVMIKAWKS